jgi:hypothetical protein
MPRLRYIVFLSFIAAVILLATRLLGGTRPALALATIMSKPDGTACDRPCLFGVRPGETSFEQATQILNSHPLTHDAKWSDDHTLQLTGPSAYVAFSLTSDELIDSITFTDNLDDSGIPVPGSLVDTITLGELILAFGKPNVALPGSNYFVPGFPDVGIIAAAARPSNLRAFVKAGTPVNMIMIYVVRPCPKNFNYFVHPWIGFKPFVKYYADVKGHALSSRVSGVPIPPYAMCQQ